MESDFFVVLYLKQISNLHEKSIKAWKNQNVSKISSIDFCWTPFGVLVFSLTQPQFAVQTHFFENWSTVLLTTYMNIEWILMRIFENLQRAKDVVFDACSNGVCGFFNFQLKTDFIGQTKVFLTLNKTWVSYWHVDLALFEYICNIRNHFGVV